MSATVCLASDTAYYPQGAGHFWVSLNWARGLQALGCKVIWLEGVASASQAKQPMEDVTANVGLLRSRLAPYGLAEDLAFYSWDGGPVPREIANGERQLRSVAEEADLLVSLSYSVGQPVADLFRRTALVDIDPGQLQVWVAQGLMTLPRYDVYFTIGETVGRPGARFPDCGIEWQYTPPPVSLGDWEVRPAPEGAPYTTISDWWGEWFVDDGEMYPNGKRDGFLPYLELPSRSPAPFELALCVSGDDDSNDAERLALEACGWRVVQSWGVASTPDDYRAYIQSSRGEFSCVKPSCVRLDNAWISDRTLCYLASGRPAIVEHTGPSRILPDDAGLFRFRTMDEAVGALETVEADYDRQSALARELAEEHFDAKKVVASLLERALA